MAKKKIVISSQADDLDSIRGASKVLNRLRFITTTIYSILAVTYT